MKNWKEIPFFQQIQKDRDDLNVSMGQKYNLDFFNEDNIFAQNDETIKEIAEGKRESIVW